MKFNINRYLTLGLLSLSASAISQELAIGEGYAYDTSGKRIIIHDFTKLWQDPDTKQVFSTDGRIFILKGNPFIRKLDYNETVLTECSEVDFFSDPLSPPSNYEDVILNEGDCRLYEMNEYGETADIVHMDSDEQVFIQENQDETMCYRVGSYAPPMIWGAWATIGSHVGTATFSISVKVYGNTIVDSQVEYYGTYGLEVRNFGSQITIRTDNALSDIRSRHQGVPFGSSLELTVC